MNEILQQRIEKAAEDYSLHNYIDEGVEVPAFIEGADFALQNQWISVEEALPPLTQESGQVYLTVDKNGYVDVKARNLDGWSSSRGWCSTERITHWMCIPSLEGGEK